MSNYVIYINIDNNFNFSKMQTDDKWKEWIMNPTNKIIIYCVMAIFFILIFLYSCSMFLFAAAIFKNSCTVTNPPSTALQITLNL